MMHGQFMLGVVGADERTRALGLRLGASSPFKEGPIRLCSWAAGPDGAEAEAMAQARATGVPFLSDWKSLLKDSQIDAVFVGGAHAGRAAVVREALVAHKAVMCPLPMALSLEELDAIAEVADGRILLTPSDLSHTIAGKKLLAEVSTGSLGRLHSVFCALRERSGAAAAVFEDLGWETVDFILQCVEAPLVRAQAFSKRLFGCEEGCVRASGTAWVPGAAGGGDDAVAFMLRFEGDIIASGEVAQSLAADSPSPREADIDVAGTIAAVRAEPYKYTVNVWSQDSRALSQRLWHTHPVNEMLEVLWNALADGRAEPGIFQRSRRLIMVMDELRKSMTG